MLVSCVTDAVREFGAVGEVPSSTMDYVSFKSKELCLLGDCVLERCARQRAHRILRSDNDSKEHHSVQHLVSATNLAQVAEQAGIDQVAMVAYKDNDPTHTVAEIIEAAVGAAQYCGGGSCSAAYELVKEIIL